MLFVNMICDLWLVGRVIVLRDYSYCISFKVINGASELSHAYVNWNACRYIGRYAECMLIIFGHISRRFLWNVHCKLYILYTLYKVDGILVKFHR